MRVHMSRDENKQTETGGKNSFPFLLPYSSIGNRSGSGMAENEMRPEYTVIQKWINIDGNTTETKNLHWDNTL